MKPYTARYEKCTLYHITSNVVSLVDGREETIQKHLLDVAINTKGKLDDIATDLNAGTLVVCPHCKNICSYAKELPIGHIEFNVKLLTQYKRQRRVCCGHCGKDV